MAESPTDDWDLLNAVASDPACLHRLFERHRDFVYRVALQKLGSVADAEDVTQEVFYKIAGMRRRFFKGAAFRTWIYRITANVASDVRGKRRDQGADPADLVSDDHADASARLRELLSAMRSLPTRQQEVARLRLLEGFDVRETAKALGCSQGTVKTHLHRATRALRVHLSDCQSEE